MRTLVSDEVVGKSQEECEQHMDFVKELGDSYGEKRCEEFCNLMVKSLRALLIEQNLAPQTHAYV